MADNTTIFPGATLLQGYYQAVSDMYRIQASVIQDCDKLWREFIEQNRDAVQNVTRSWAETTAKSWQTAQEHITQPRFRSTP